MKTSLTSPPGVQNFLGVGYDIIDGNPEGGEINNGGVDPGLKTTFRVFDFTYDKGIEMYGYAIPDQVSYVDRQSSVSTSSRDIFHGTQSYVQKLEKESNIRGSAKIIRGRFSKSKNYESIQAGVEYRGLVYYENKTVALEAEARYNWELAEQEQYPLDNGFVVEACSLPASYHETNYMQFLQRRGTHVVTSVNLGSRKIERYEEETQGFVHYARENVAKSTSLRAGFMGYSIGLAVDMEEFKANLGAGMKFGSKTHTFTSGSFEPIHTGLDEIDEVFKAEYWTRFEDYVAAGLCDPSWIDTRESVAKNMMTALTGYAVWRNAQDAIDHNLVAIPITWPKGKYTLPKPTTGCPNAHFTFPDGYRYHDTEDKDSNNHWSSSNHLAGYKNKNNMEHWFCSKTREEEDIYDWAFQPGKYCVMRKGSSCPAGSNMIILTPREEHFIHEALAPIDWAWRCDSESQMSG
eukprot:XP_011668996.1 PREDICTED: uncharacterized protein LOC575120 [Strongylocentrotus purpuratus]